MVKKVWHRATRHYFSDRLRDAFSATLDYPLSVIHAPIGYGKTTAARALLPHLAASVTWMQVYDASIELFWRGFCAMVAEVAPQYAALSDHPFPSDSASQSRAIESLFGIPFPGDTFLVIDDYHRIKDERIHAFIEQLVRREIPNLHVMLLVRDMHFWFLPELRVKGSALYLRQDTLALPLEDVQRFFHRNGQLINHLEAVRAYELTEGWMAGLDVLLQGYARRKAFEPVLELIQLVATGVFLPIDKDSREMLFQLCLLDEIALDQAMALTGRADTGPRLHALYRQGTFIEYDHARGVYRLHASLLFFLRAELRVLPGADRIYARAAQYMESHGDMARALRIYLETGDYERIFARLSDDRGSTALRLPLAVLDRMYHGCPFSIRRSYPLALIAYCYCVGIYGDEASTRAVLAEISEAIENGERAQEDSQTLRGELALLMGVLRLDREDRTDAHFKLAHALLDGRTGMRIYSESALYGGAPSFIGAHHAHGMPLEQSLNAFRAHVRRVATLTGSGHGADVVMEAEAHYQRGAMEKAAIVAHRAYALARDEHQMGVLCCAHFVLLRIAQYRGDQEEANAQLEAMRALPRGGETIGVDLVLTLCELWYALSEARPENLARIEAECAALYDHLPTRARGFTAILYMRCLALSAQAEKLVGMSIPYMANNHNLGELEHIYAHIYIAVALRRLFRRDEARAELATALSLAERDNLIAPFIENRGLLEPLFDDMTGPLEESIRQCVAAHGERDRKAAHPPKRLTARELEIARLAAQNLTNAQIAARLYISTNTVKMALKSIFSKLGIRSRVLLPAALSGELQSE